MILGLTGSIGSGKSTALSAFAAAGARVFDADALVHGLYEQVDSALVRRLAARWGTRIFTAGGTVSRRTIGEIVFADVDELDFLTGQLYPELETMVAALLAPARRAGGATVFEVPLLFECGWEKKFDRTATVYADAAVRHARLLARGFASAEAIAVRERRQLSAAEKLERADYGLINHGPETLLRRQCEALMTQFDNHNNTMK